MKQAPLIWGLLSGYSSCGCLLAIAWPFWSLVEEMLELEPAFFQVLEGVVAKERPKALSNLRKMARYYPY